jgi:hypothetical protein
VTSIAPFPVLALSDSIGVNDALPSFLRNLEDLEETVQFLFNTHKELRTFHSPFFVGARDFNCCRRRLASLKDASTASLHFTSQLNKHSLSAPNFR